MIVGRWRVAKHVDKRFRLSRCRWWNGRILRRRLAAYWDALHHAHPNIMHGQSDSTVVSGKWATGLLLGKEQKHCQ